MKHFNVIIEDFNSHGFVAYDVIPYIMQRYKEERAKPTTFDQFKEFVERKSFYQWYSRCEYEIVLKPWVGKDENSEQRIDVYWQILLNLDIITQIVVDEVLNYKKIL